MVEVVSLTFVVFLCVTCAVAWAVPPRARYIWLLAASYLFYVYSPDDPARNLPALGLMLCATLVSYLAALGMSRTDNRHLRRLLLAVSLLCCLGLLFICRDMGAVFALAGGRTPFELVLPLGISFYTLQAVGYAIDVYKNEVAVEKNPLRYALYVSFLPGIFAGPVNRAGRMLAQYKSPADFDYGRLAGGAFRILWGYFKLMVLAGNIAPYTEAVLAVPGGFTGPYLIIAALLFMYQIYVELSGLCDIAVGAALMLGFEFAEDFARPFAATSFAQLWQRWRMSAVSFMRDYVFLPLTRRSFVPGQSPRGVLGYLGFILAMLASFVLLGLWHGVSEWLLVWAALSGAIVCISTLMRPVLDKLAGRVPIYRARGVRKTVQKLFVLAMFCVTMVFFASYRYGAPVYIWFSRLGRGWELGSGALKAMGTRMAQNGLDILTLLVLVSAALLVQIVEKFAVKPGSNVAVWVRQRYFFVRWPLYLALVAGIVLFGWPGVDFVSSIGGLLGLA